MSNSQFTPDEVIRLKKLVAITAESPRVTHVIQVLDSSSSMQMGKDITISTYNEQLQVMKAAQETDGSIVTTSLITFANTAAVSYSEAFLANVPPLSEASYKTNGMTALYDAIGLAIELGRKLATDDNTAFLLQIFTDGAENASTKYKQPQIKSMIEELNATGKWTVTVAGPKGNIDLFVKDLAIYAGNTTTFDPSSLTSRALNKSNMVGATAQYFSARAGGQSSMRNAYSSVVEDQQKVKDLLNDKTTADSQST